MKNSGCLRQEYDNACKDMEAEGGYQPVPISSEVITPQVIKNPSPSPLCVCPLDHCQNDVPTLNIPDNDHDYEKHLHSRGDSPSMMGLGARFTAAIQKSLFPTNEIVYPPPQRTPQSHLLPQNQLFYILVPNDPTGWRSLKR